MSNRTAAVIAFSVLARAVSAEASHVIPTGLVLEGGFPVQVDLEFSAYDPPPTGPFHLVMDAFSWTATATGGVVIEAWEPGPALVAIPSTNPQLYWAFESSATGLGGLGAVVTGNKLDPYNYGAADWFLTPILPLGTFTISATGPGEIVFDALYRIPDTPEVPLVPIHETVIQVVPEPSTALLLAAGLAGLALDGRSRSGWRKAWVR